MIKKYKKTIAETFLLQLIFSALAFFFTPWFSWLHDKMYLFSIITAWLYLGALHSTFWQLGRKDMKNIVIANNHVAEGEELSKPKLYTGAVLGLFLLIFNIILVVMASFNFDVVKYNPATDSQIFSPSLIFMVHRFLISPFMGFLPASYGGEYVLRCIIICFIMYIPCVVAYITGTYDFSLLDKYFHKIIYKQKK